MDTLLRCPICHELLDSAVGNQVCGHVFCSLCIRRYLTSTKTCPICFEGLEDRQLSKYGLIDGLVASFKVARGEIYRALESHSKAVEKKYIKEIGEEICDIDSGKVAKSGLLLAGKRKEINVECPNCSEYFMEREINSHLDACLSYKAEKGDSKTIETAPSLNDIFGKKRMIKKMPKPNKLVYSMLSESKLRKICKELGIPSNGSKQQMEARHSEWINRYLANEDSSAPKPHSKLLNDLNKWEHAVISKPPQKNPLMENANTDTFDAKEYYKSSLLIFLISSIKCAQLIYMPFL
ncbi:Postreplication repair E3 ubiquitin-protein ligase rad18 [Smittium mucronatum]|uniref:Postreplication repair E3 ubiquitin-protein ligase RAD18 n=1 Tax=Smittium mucronatum TaxID=133383 RepID=A0A1R0GVG1_9FUNG|nr:Postreplication repair E3 ubiquitin-protein ligase rad18 [Smittium mucronatum]